MGTDAHKEAVGVNVHVSKEAPNLIINGAFQVWTNGVSSQPDDIENEGTPAVAQATGERDNFFDTPFAVRYTATGAGNEGGKITLSRLKASTSYGIHIRAKATAGDTARLFTIGASVNVDQETALTDWVSLSGTFTTNATPTDVVIKFVAKNDGDIVWFDSLIVVEGNVIPTFAPQAGVQEGIDIFFNSLGVGVAATGTQGQIKMQAADGLDTILTMVTTSNAREMDVYLDAGSNSDTISFEGKTSNVNTELSVISQNNFKARLMVGHIGDVNGGVLEYDDTFVGGATIGTFTVKPGSAAVKGIIGDANGRIILNHELTARSGVIIERQSTSDIAVQVAALSRVDVSPSVSSWGYLNYELTDDSSSQAVFARHTWGATDIAAASKDGFLRWSVMVADSLTDILTVDGNGITVEKVGLTATFQNITDAVSNQVAIFKGGNRGTPVDNDEAYNSFFLDDSTGTQVEFARQTFIATDVTNTTKAAGYQIELMQNNTLRDYMHFAATTGVNTGTIVFNEDGQSVDFRVEASGVEYALVVQGSSGAVLINRSTPLSSEKLSVDGFAVFSGRLTAPAATSLQLTGGLNSTDANSLFVTPGGDFGFGIASPDNKVHVWESSAGSVSSRPESVVTIEKAGDAALQFLSPNTATQYIFFGDVNANNVAWIAYDHSNNGMHFRVNALGNVVSLTSGGEVFMPFVYSDNVGAAADLLIKSDGQLGRNLCSERYKTNVDDAIDSDTAWIHNIRIVKYDRKDGSAIGEIGTLAEEVNLINSNMVSYKRIKGAVQVNGKDVYYDTDEPEGVEKSRFVFPILREVQKLRRDLDVHINA